jgi:hypothetical protein
MAAVPDDQAERIRERLELIRDLAQHGLSADDLHQRDDREWFRSLLRVFGDVRIECEAAERELSGVADAKEILSPSEIAEAARISRGAVYKRRNLREK